MCGQPLLYGCETWTISVAMQKKIDAFETWLYRRLLRISWKDMVTNEEVYRRMNIKQSLLVDIVRRQMSFMGHVLRKEEMEHLVVTGFIDGKRARGRQRETFLTYLGKFTNKPPMELLRLAKDRVVWSKNNNQRLYEDMILLDDEDVRNKDIHSYNTMNINLLRVPKGSMNFETSVLDCGMCFS